VLYGLCLSSLNYLQRHKTNKYLNKWSRNTLVNIVISLQVYDAGFDFRRKHNFFLVLNFQNYLWAYMTFY